MGEFEDDGFLLVGSSINQVFDVEALRQIYSSHPTLKEDLQELNLSDITLVLRFYRMGTKELRAFVDGAVTNTDDGAQLEYSPPKNLRQDS